MLTQLLKLKTQLSYFNATWTNAKLKVEFPRAWTEYDSLSKTIKDNFHIMHCCNIHWQEVINARKKWVTSALLCLQHLESMRNLSPHDAGTQMNLNQDLWTDDPCLYQEPQRFAWSYCYCTVKWEIFLLSGITGPANPDVAIEFKREIAHCRKAS